MRENPENDSLVHAFGLQVAEALYAENTDSFNLLFRWDRFMDLALELPPEHQDLARYRDQFKSGIKTRLEAFPQQLIQVMAEGGYYDLLHFYFDESLRTYRLVFRLYSTSGINYHDYIIRKSGEDLYMEDVYVYTNGENMSISTRNLFLASLPASLAERLFQASDRKDTRRMIEAMNAYEQGSYGQAYYKLSMLEGPMAHLKSVHALRIHMASQLDEQTYMEAMQAMMEDHPEDPAMALLTLDYHTLKGNYDSALQIVDLLEASTGDTFLNLMRGNVHYQAGQYQTATALFRSLTEEYPEFLEGHLSLMSAMAMDGDYPGILTELSSLNETYAVSVEDLQEYIESETAGMENPFADFMQTPGYRNWISKHL